MREPILMPSLSDTMESGHFIQWLKQPGDAVKKGEAVAEVESDKAIMDVEAFHDGYLAGPLVAEDTDLPVGAVLAYLVDRPEEVSETQAEKPSRTKQAASEKRPATENKSAASPETAVAVEKPATPSSSRPSSSNTTHVKASPYARGLACELGIDLSQLAPAADGSIHGRQVLAAALGRPEARLDDGPAYELQAMTPMQRAVANNMIAAAATPTFRTSARFALGPIRNLAKDKRFSLTLLLARACALTIQKHPRFNAAYTLQGLAQRQQVDVGIAVDVPNGLLTPVLRNVTEKPLNDLQEEWRLLKDRAMGKTPRHRLTPEDYRGATFYLSNLGMFSEVVHFDAVVPVGAAAILAVATVQDGVAEYTLSCDHRVVYGADAARFLHTLGEILDKPQTLLSGD